MNVTPPVPGSECYMECKCSQEHPYCYEKDGYCYEDEEAGTWVDEEIQLCEEYASDADSHTCECTCDDDSACN